MKKINKREIGGTYEKLAGKFLEKKGLKILQYNFRCRTGEIDLIAKDGAYYVFVEVKYRHTKDQGWAVEAVNKNKQQKILRVAQYYLITNVHSVDVPCRFDVLAIDGEEITWYQDAFQL